MHAQPALLSAAPSSGRGSLRRLVSSGGPPMLGREWTAACHDFTEDFPMTVRPADATPALDQRLSLRASTRLAELVPGGAHTYAKGPDQYPADTAPIIARGRGSHVWDVDGNEYIEFGSGLRSVILGHSHPVVLEAVRRQLGDGSNFARPSYLEISAAEDFLEAVPSMDMVKFTKNGSDATSAAIRLARAVTGRDMVAQCHDQPFFSTDDWFIGTTPMRSGIPRELIDLTVGFPYGDLSALELLFDSRPGEISCVILEAATGLEPPPGYLQGVVDLAHKHGALVIFDEMITGFRWSLHGAQSVYGVTPDLSTFGKGIGNGFSVSALAGKREYMERGGLNTSDERVFLLSTTHGAEGHSLAALRAVIAVHRAEAVSDRLHEIGERLAGSIRAVLADHGLAEHIVVKGRACNLVFATLDQAGEPSQAFRTLLMRQLIRYRVLAPSFVVSTAIDSKDIERTVDAVRGAAVIYNQALDHGDPTPWLGGRPVRPVFRTRA